MSMHISNHCSNYSFFIKGPFTRSVTPTISVDAQDGYDSFSIVVFRHSVSSDLSTNA